MFERLFLFPTQPPNLSKLLRKVLYTSISSKYCMIRFGIRFPEICFENSSFLSYPLKSKSKRRTWLSAQTSAISHQLYTKNSIKLMRRLAEILLLEIFLLLLISYFYCKQFLVIYFCDCFCLYSYLFGRFKSIKGKLFSAWIRQLEQKWTFLWS